VKIKSEWQMPDILEMRKLANTPAVRSLTPLIGAEISGVDLTDLTPDLVQFIRDALLTHSVVFFRNQALTIEQHKDLGRAFGELLIHPATIPKIPEHPEINVIESGANSKKVAGEVWHSDISSQVEPPMGSILYMKEVPPTGGGDTLFASTNAAYDALSQAMKSFLSGLTAIHDTERLRGGAYIKNPTERFGFAEHPVVRTHPETKRKSLFVNGVFTSHIVQLSKSESDALLGFLYRHQEAPQFQCRFKWEPGSIAFWDNRCTLHHAVWDYYPHRRYGHRVTICGDRPF